MMRKLFLLICVSACVLATNSCTRHKTLSLLVWEGYADPSFVKGFEDKCACKVQASYMGSSDELMAKLRGGSAANYDVISPSSDVAGNIAAEHPQDVDARRRADESFRAARSGRRDGMAADDKPAAREEFPDRRNHPPREHNRMDRPPDDHIGKPQQRAGRAVSGIYDRGEDAESGRGRHRIHACECGVGSLDESRTAQGTPSR